MHYMYFGGGLEERRHSPRPLPVLPVTIVPGIPP
eukprot:SAG22_NODE_16778_length_318_cov_0.698630_1_plen_33_part_01